MEQKSSQKIAVSSFLRNNPAPLLLALGGIILGVLILAAAPQLLDMIWHYGVCFFLVIGCWISQKLGNQKAAAVLAILTCAAAVAGFFLVYAGPFAGSGKTLAMYVGRYGAVTLPVFLFPLAAVIMAARGRMR